MSLDDLFARKVGRRRSAQDTFTDRVDQARAFADSLAAVRAASGNAELIAQLGAPRWNVLSFYGMGGIGKSALAVELDRRFHDGEFSPEGAATRSITVDFDASRDRSFEELLLRIRSAVADVGTWRAFDLAFAGYWEQRHPGVALRAIPDQFARLRRTGEAWGIGDNIQATVETVLDASTFGLIGVGRRLGTLAVREVIGRVNERRLLQGCPLFEQITLERDPDSVLAYLPHLLAWDLHQSQLKRLDDGSAADVVIFLDTWEDLQRGSSGRGGLEDLVTRLVYLMPNVLFVVLGRDRLDWASEHKRASLTFSGTGCWPGLVAGVTHDPTQHLLGGLGRADRERYLMNCRVSNGVPMIQEPVRRAISEASEGLPYFLDLAADYFDEIQARGADPSPADFAVPFPELVGRVLRDLLPAERNLLSAAAVAGSFDARLLAHLVPQALPSDIDRFLTRHLVGSTTSPWLPYRIHDRLRESVIAFRDPFQDTWADDRWSQARVAAAGWLTDTVLVDSDTGAAGAEDLARALLLTAGLVKHTGIVPRRLPLLLWRVQQAGGLTSLLEVEVRLADSGKPAVEALGTACRAALRNLRTAQPIPPEVVAQAWKDAPTEELRDLLGLYLGDILDVAADLTGAQAAFDSVSAGTPEFKAAATRLQAAILLRRSRFRDTLRACEALPGPDAAARAANDSLRGMTHYWSAWFGPAADWFESSLQNALDASLRLWVARAARHKYLALAWGALGEDEELRQFATEWNEAVGSGIGLAQIDAAHALNRYREGDPEGGRQLLAGSLASLESQRAESDILMVLACQVACAVMVDDVPGARRVHETLLARWKSLDTGPLWPFVSGLLSGADLEGLTEPQWLDGAGRARWRNVFGRPT